MELIIKRLLDKQILRCKAMRWFLVSRVNPLVVRQTPSVNAMSPVRDDVSNERGNRNIVRSLKNLSRNRCKRLREPIHRLGLIAQVIASIDLKSKFLVRLITHARYELSIACRTFSKTSRL